MVSSPPGPSFMTINVDTVIYVCVHCDYFHTLVTKLHTCTKEKNHPTKVEIFTVML